MDNPLNHYNREYLDYYKNQNQGYSDYYKKQRAAGGGGGIGPGNQSSMDNPLNTMDRGTMEFHKKQSERLNAQNPVKFA